MNFNYSVTKVMKYCFKMRKKCNFTYLLFYCLLKVREVLVSQPRVRNVVGIKYA